MKGFRPVTWLGVILLVLAGVFILGRPDPSGATEAGVSGTRNAARLRRMAERRSRQEARAALQQEARAAVRRKRAQGGGRPVRRVLTPAELKEREKARFVKRLFAENAKADGFSADDRAFLDTLEEAEQSNDIDLVSDAAQAALKCGNRDLRLAAIESLATFGEAGIPELADFIADPDPDVAAMAVDRYEMGLQDVENEAEVAVYAKLAAMSLKDESQIELMLSQIQMVSDELIAVQAMVDLIDEGGEEVAAATRRLYEDYTGEEWTGFDDAEKWLQENYEPEPPDEETEGP